MNHIRMIFSLAYRNLGRNKRRTFSTLVSIAVGLIALAFLSGYINYSMWGLKETIIRSGTGHLQVSTADAYFDEGDNDPFPYLFSSTDSIQKKIQALPEVRDVVPTISFTAVLSFQGKMETVSVKAFPAEGVQDNLNFVRIDEGLFFQEDASGRIVVGKALAQKLGLKLESEVSVFAVDAHGGVQNQVFTVSAFASTKIAQVDAHLVYMDLISAQKLLATQQVPQLTVYLESTQDTDTVKAKISNLGSVKTWSELSPYYQQASSSYSMVQTVAQFVVLIVTIFSISGTLGLSILERLREVGTLRAFGTKRHQIVSMLTFEGLMIAVAGAVCGTLLGWGIVSIVNSAGGVPMPAQPGMSEGISIFFQLDPVSTLGNAVMISISSLAGAAIPGIFASRRNTASLLRSPH